MKINYNGMELEEFTSDKPVAFPKGTRAICWDADKYEEGFRSELDIVAFIPYLTYPVLTRDCLNNYQDSPYGHCALLPDHPKPRRATNRELSRWLAQGNGEVYDEDNSDKIIWTLLQYLDTNENLEVLDGFKVRKWSDTEWHEPTVDYLFGGDDADR